MATIVLGLAGQAIGGAIGGSILGLSAVAIGGAIGSFAGAALDATLFAPSQNIEGQKLGNVPITSSTEGAVIPRVHGRFKVGGNMFWSTRFLEQKTTTSQGGKGGPTITTTEFTYSVSFAVGLCEGEISGIGRVWADGKEINLDDFTHRIYTGTEDQTPDPFIVSKMDPEPVSAHRGTAYIVFEGMELKEFGNHRPQMAFEVFRPLLASDTLEGLGQAVAMIPGAGEFVLATTDIQAGASGDTVSENTHTESGQVDIVTSLDRLETALPNAGSVSLVVSWFGDDLRADQIAIKPGVEVVNKTTTPKTWSVDGVYRISANVVSKDGNGNPVYGGTPADFAVVEAIREMQTRGLRVTFLPFLLMDIPAGNILPDPYSDNAATLGQAAYPWRGRITCSPAAGYVGTVDKTSAASAQIDAFFGSAATTDYSVSGTSVTYTGPAEWSYRRMVLHYAHLCAAAGGVESFLIGSELRGLTQIRNGIGVYLAVTRLRALAADVKSILPLADIGYAADWSEYFGHQPGDGSGDVFFHLDPLWADANIDFVGIDNYLPISDWRDGIDHLDAVAGAPGIYDRVYLDGNVEGGELFDWFYASDADRAAQARTAVTDGAYGKPWVFRPKDIRGWWSNPHYNRPLGVENSSPTGWVAQSKPIRFTEIGCAAIDRGSNQPNAFIDSKSSESAAPYSSRGWRDDAIQRRFLEIVLGHWTIGANNPTSTVYAAPMIDLSECAIWAWDARPYPEFPTFGDVWRDAPHYLTGHWITGRAGSVPLAALISDLAAGVGMAASDIDVSSLWQVVEGMAITAMQSPRASIAPLQRHYAVDAVESGGMIRFSHRGKASVLTISPGDLVSVNGGDPIEKLRAQETELPAVLKWGIFRSDEAYDSSTVEARWETTKSVVIASETFPIATDPQEAERRARGALMETWVGRETLTAALPPSKLAFDAGDVITLSETVRSTEYRLTSVADAGARPIEATRHDAKAYDLPPGPPFDANLQEGVTYGPPLVALMNLPRLTNAAAAALPYGAAWARRWAAPLEFRRSETLENFRFSGAAAAPAIFGTLAADLPAGPVWQWDMGNTILIDLVDGALASATDEVVLQGGNVLAIESSTGAWEIVQFGVATLESPLRYRLSRLLRGQRGTEAEIGAPALSGARVVVLDSNAVIAPAITSDEIGVLLNWRIGAFTTVAAAANVTAMTFTATARGLQSFSPVHPVARLDTATGDITLRWLRRSRALDADSWSTTVALDEPFELYSVDILDAPGGAVVRTKSALNTTEVVYTLANQTADFGAALTSIDVNIYEIGEIGRGAALSATVEISEAT